MPTWAAVASLGRPAHRRFAAPPDVQELLQMGSFSTASDACCACGALQTVVTVTPRPAVDYEPGDLLVRVGRMRARRRLGRLALPAAHRVLLHLGARPRPRERAVHKPLP